MVVIAVLSLTVRSRELEGEIVVRRTVPLVGDAVISDVDVDVLRSTSFVLNIVLLVVGVPEPVEESVGRGV